jgi:hypothetical protein
VNPRQSASRWTELLREAYAIIDHVNNDHNILTDWTFGGGTAMMIQIDHRESHDVDLFLDDPQLLPYVEASVAEMQFALGEATYNGDGSGHLKVAFDGIGEIDFIVTAHMTVQPTQNVELEGRTVALETIPEIVAKKVRFRGSRVQPRDIFDIAAGVEAGFGPDIQAALAEIPDYVGSTLTQLDKLSVDYVNQINAQLMLRSTSEHLVQTAYETTRALLQEI